MKKKTTRVPRVRAFSSVVTGLRLAPASRRRVERKNFSATSASSIDVVVTSVVSSAGNENASVVVVRRRGKKGRKEGDSPRPARVRFGVSISPTRWSLRCADVRSAPPTRPARRTTGPSSPVRLQRHSVHVIARSTCQSFIRSLKSEERLTCHSFIRLSLDSSIRERRTVMTEEPR